MRDRRLGQWPASMVLSLSLGAAALSSCADKGGFSTGGDGAGTPGQGVCTPAERKCEAQQVVTCLDDGSGWRPGKKCVFPESCENGECIDPCSLAKATRSYVGCEYFAVDLENLPHKQEGTGYSPADAQYALVVSYAGTREEPVSVKVFTKTLGVEREVATDLVYPGKVTVFKLGPQNVIGSGKKYLAFRVQASAPVTVYQFNPLNNTEEAYSNDASLLLPVPSLDTEYIAVSGDSSTVVLPPNKTYLMGAYVAVVGVTDKTTVTVDPAVDLRAGEGIAAGVSRQTFTLNRYEVLSLATGFGNGKNLSGTRIKADQPIAVFGGNGCASAPTTANKCCCDHLEEQLFPLSAWGKRYVAARSMPRVKSGAAEPDRFRLTAGAKAVSLDYTPSQPDGAPTTLEAGSSVEFSATESFMVMGSEPFLVTQFLVSAGLTGELLQTPERACTSTSDCQGLAFAAKCYRVPPTTNRFCAPVGDPSMILIPPVEQFRKEYVFLVPDDYLIDYATVIAPLGAVIKLDKQIIAAPANAIGTFNGLQYGVLHQPLSDGAHTISANQPVGVLAYGLDAYVSYGYPAGLDLKRINLE